MKKKTATVVWSIVGVVAVVGIVAFLALGG